MRKILFFLFFPAFLANGQTVSTAFPSLQLPVDARSAAMAGAGTAMDADISSVNANPARLALIQSQHTLSFDLLPFTTISRDAKKMALKYAVRSTARSTVGVSLNYYTTGMVILRNDIGADIGMIKQSEYYLTLSYGLQVASGGFLGGSLRYLYQGNLTSLNENQVVSGGAAVGADLGYLQHFPLSDDFEKIKAGISINNIGSKLSGLYQPMSLSLGMAYSNGYFDADNRSMLPFAITAGVQVDKPLVPMLPEYDASGNITAGKSPDRSVLSNIFSTWSDAPGGFKENLKAIRYSVYSEAVFQRIFAVRAGYAHENPLYGSRNYLSLGAGIGWEYQDTDYTVNLSFQQPIGSAASYSPLKNAFGLQFLIQFGAK